MSIISFPNNALVLYKNQAARIVQHSDKKLEIVTSSGNKVRVRPKDVTLLHPGPISNLASLARREGDIETAWELLAGEVVTLEELAELAFDDFTPQTAWASWLVVADGVYFSGSPDAIRAHSEAEVTAVQTTRAAKAAEEQEWQAFLTRAKTGEMAQGDGRFLQEVVAVALGQRPKSQVLRALKQSETPENAQSLLLKMGYWDETNNPHPARAGVTTTQPNVSLRPLPDEPRRDLTHLTAVAIDDAGSRDPDDALSWDDGKLWVHVADVAALIPPDSPADLEARARGANLYLPEGTVPMLPEAATEALALGLDDNSPALSFAINVDNEGEVTLLEIVPSLIHVTRLSYKEAETQLEESPFRELYTVAQRFEARRQRNGAIGIDLPEVKIRVGKDGKVAIRPLPKLRSRDLVRDAMLMTGEAVARYAFQNGLAIPYTTQDEPTESLPSATTPSENFAVRRTMKPSRPSGTPGAHAGLGMGFYVQATSPLRRYLDLVVHQQLRAHLSGQPTLDEQELMARVGAAGAITGEVRYAERQSNRHWTMVYLMQNPEWQGEAIIIEKRGRKELLLLPDLAIETRMYLKDERPLDSQLTIELNKVNLVQLEAHFRLLVKE